MSRISSSSFAVNSDLEQLVSISNTTAIPVSDSIAQSSLSTLANGVSSNQYQVAIAASSATVSTSDSTAQSTLSSIQSNTANIPAAGQAVMASSLPVVIASNQSAISVSSTNANNSGSANNLNSSSSVASGDFSSEIDVRAAKNITILGQTSDTSGTKIELHVSASSGSGFIPWSYQIYPDASGFFTLQLQGVAVNYLKLKYFSTATVSASALYN